MGKATMMIEGFEARVSFDADRREYEGSIELPATGEFEAEQVLFRGRDLDELEANGHEILSATREAVLGQ